MDKDVAVAKRRRWPRSVRRALLGVSILVAASQATLAVQTTLVCSGPWGLFTIDLNEAAGAVTLNYPAKPVPETVPPSVIPASTVGPFAAKFNGKSIPFVSPFGDPTVHENWTLDRLTGVLLEYRGVNAPYDRATLRNVFSHTCHVGRKQF
jgi:hypothetical protein